MEWKHAVIVKESKGLFVDFQNGCRNGRSTMGSVAVLDQDDKKAFENKEITVCF